MNSNKSSPPTPNPPDEILRLSELAERLKVHTSTLYRMIKRGELPYFRVGSDYRVNWRDIQEWMHDKAKSGDRK